MGLEADGNGRIKVNPRTLETNLEGVFAGGDLVTGPNTVIDAIAAGKKAALVIDRYLQGRQVETPSQATLPSVFIPPPWLMILKPGLQAGPSRPQLRPRRE
jgi:pyruvate/2-oxoglutarate dehydrogenase complex dihydrolipoamide dehydrogenase (E3) component